MMARLGWSNHITKKGPWQRSAQLVEDPYLRVEMISKGSPILSKLDWILPRACKSEEV